MTNLYDLDKLLTKRTMRNMVNHIRICVFNVLIIIIANKFDWEFSTIIFCLILGNILMVMITFIKELILDRRILDAYEEYAHNEARELAILINSNKLTKPTHIKEFLEALNELENSEDN